MERSELLAFLYGHARVEAGRYDAQLWQLPAVSYALNGAVASFLVREHWRGGASVGASVALLIFTIPLTTAMIKNRMFQRARSAYIKEVFKQLCDGHDGVHDIPTTSTEARQTLAKELIDDGIQPHRLENFGDGLFGAFSAYAFLLAGMLTTHVAQVALIVATIIRS